MESEFASLHRRFDDEREARKQQHAENQDMLREIRAEAKLTNGRITRLESIAQTLKDEFQGIRERWHKFRESIQDSVSKLSNGPEKGELAPVTRLDAKSAVGIFILGMSVILGLLKIMGKV
jgi:predicted nuclease with TOPRIM domain